MEDQQQVYYEYRQKIRSLMIGIQILFVAYFHLVLGLMIFTGFIFNRFFRNDLHIYSLLPWVDFLSLFFSLLILYVQHIMLMKHYAPQLGLKPNARFDFVSIEDKSRREANIDKVIERKRYIIFITMYICFLAFSCILGFYSSYSNNDYLYSLQRLFLAICFFLYYVVHTYIAFAGKYYVMDFYKERE